VIECPFCNWTGEREGMIEFGQVRKKKMCPSCGSLPRHRTLYFLLPDLIPKNKKINILHFAPEKSVTNLLKTYPHAEYLSIDLDPTKAMQKEDITNLSFNDNSFDFIICIHVLEHIIDDKRAMSEIYRVLKKGGTALIEVPQDTGDYETFENFSITSPEERIKFFGQEDHVRIYGEDIKQRLANSGFDVEVSKFAFEIPDEKIERHYLKKENIYLCRKD